MDFDTKVYLILGTILTLLLTLLFHFPLGQPWGFSLLYALAITVFGVWLLDTTD